MFLLFQSCRKDKIEEFAFIGDYSIDIFTKNYSWDHNDSYLREVNVLGDTGTDYRKAYNAPNEGDPGGVYIWDYDAEVMLNNFKFTNDKRWMYSYQVTLQRDQGTRTEFILHELTQAGTFKLLEPELGTEGDFNVALYFDFTDCYIHNKYVKYDGEIQFEYDASHEIENANSLHN